MIAGPDFHLARISLPRESLRSVLTKKFVRMQGDEKTVKEMYCSTSIEPFIPSTQQTGKFRSVVTGCYGNV